MLADEIALTREGLGDDLRGVDDRLPSLLEERHGAIPGPGRQRTVIRSFGHLLASLHFGLIRLLDRLLVRLLIRESRGTQREHGREGQSQ